MHRTQALDLEGTRRVHGSPTNAARLRSRPPRFCGATRFRGRPRHPADASQPPRAHGKEGVAGSSPAEGSWRKAC